MMIAMMHKPMVDIDKELCVCDGLICDMIAFLLPAPNTLQRLLVLLVRTVPYVNYGRG